MQVIEDSGHMTLEEKPEVFTRPMTEFLDCLETPGAAGKTP